MSEYLLFSNLFFSNDLCTVISFITT